MHDDDALTPSEREALQALPRTAQPGDLVEERTVRALAARGLLRSRHRIPTAIVWTGAAAACVVFFVAGFGVGASRSVRPAPETTLETVPVDTASTRAVETASGVALTEGDPSSKGQTQVVVWF